MPVSSLNLGPPHNTIDNKIVRCKRKRSIKRIQRERTNDYCKGERAWTNNIHREITEEITEGGKEVPNPEGAKEWARRSGTAKETTGAAETGNEYEQGAAGSNK